MKLAATTTVLLALSGVAYAQAPGEYEMLPPGMAPVQPAVVVQPPPRIRRFSIGVGVGSLDLAPHGQPDNETEFSIGQLSVRYLATRHIELELAFSGGRQQLEDGGEGELEVNQVVAALRWRFKPQRRWNWWLMAGMGTLSVAPEWASEDEREYAAQSTLQFGVGLERRFRRFAIQAELRAVGVAPNEEMGFKPLPEGPPRDQMTPLPPLDTQGPAGGKSGGQFSISGNYYF